MIREICLPSVAEALLKPLITLVVVFVIIGCQSQSNPWTGEKYQDPIAYRDPPQAIYAPNFRIQPSIDGTAVETDQMLEAELDLLTERD